MGCLRIGVATPWDDCPYGKSNANTFVRACAYRVFPDLVCRDQPRGHPEGAAGPKASVDPSTLGRKTLYALASLKYCYNAYVRRRHCTLQRYAVLSRSRANK